MKLSLLQELRKSQSEHRTAGLITAVETGAQRILFEDGTLGSGDLILSNATQEKAVAALRADRSEFLDSDTDPVFLKCFSAPLQLYLVGAVHIAQALAPMAALAGYRVTIIDPRRAFATLDRFPMVDLVTDWPDDALLHLPINSRTAIATLTHDPKLDDPALHTALKSSAFYIGALGSKRTHANRLERLRFAGFDEMNLTRIHAPIGLAIGARSPAEIAIAILAEMTATRRIGGTA